MLWEEGEITNALYGTATSFQRKTARGLARLVEDAKEREAAGLEPEDDLDDRIESEVQPKLAKIHGASALIANVRKLTKKVEDAEKALGKLGFSCDEDSISLKYDAPKNLKSELAEAKRAALKERQAAMQKYDRAILDIWAAGDTQEAKRTVEGII